MTTFETVLRAVLLSTAVLVSTPAAGDPLKDDLDAIRKEFCEGEPFNECLAKFRAAMASNQGYQEADLQVCPRMVVTDPQLRDFRNKKYRDSPDFDRGYQYVSRARIPVRLCHWRHAPPSKSIPEELANDRVDGC